MTQTPMARYRALVKDGALNPDPAQNLGMEKLQMLHERLKGYEPKTPKKHSRGWFGWGREPRHDVAEIGGLYIYGGVGRGKSMLMDLFAETSPVSPTRRVHFHAFMQEIHALIGDARKRNVEDPIAEAAEKTAASATLLCFDEMQITDIADAMIVGRLFEALFRRGVVVVTTSNRHPDDLYKNGLSRELFLPFIALMKEKLDLHHLDGAADHRQDRLRGEPRYLAPLGPQTDAAMDRIWEECAAGPDQPLELSVKGRKVDFARARLQGRAVRATFDELCRRPLGAADYLELAEVAHTLLIEGVPRLSRANNNEATRFVHLVDALYEAKRLVYVSAEASPETLYTEGAGSFEFERTASRLEEMQGQDWPPQDEG
ncbi:cell division protein ZapE [Rhodovulum sp. DZ06]|uniref:cell division protein ZapE n=1 Tax=Rhodovulum sp. DZ06 TaxID=3425126 RepID=UPI003D34A802